MIYMIYYQIINHDQDDQTVLQFVYLGWWVCWCAAAPPPLILSITNILPTITTVIKIIMVITILALY